MGACAGPKTVPVQAYFLCFCWYGSMDWTGAGGWESEIPAAGGLATLRRNAAHDLTVVRAVSVYVVR